MNSIIFPEKARQSKEVTDAYQQYCGNIVKYWDRFLILIREEFETLKAAAVSKGKPLNREALVDRLASRTFDKSFCKRIDSQHPERVKDALFYISKHPLVEECKDGSFKVLNLISECRFDAKKWVITTEFNVRSIFRHYLRDKLTVEYNPLLKDSFKNKVTAALYMKGCAMSSEIEGFFEFDENQIRLFLSYDVITDIDQLDERNISDIRDIPSKKARAYDFCDLKADVIDKALEEIEGAFKAGLCNFYLSLDVQTLTIPREGRGGMKKEHKLRFFIEHDADALHPIQSLVKTVKSVDDRVQDLFPETMETGKKINAVAERILGVFKRAGYSYGEKYKKVIISDIKARLSVQPNLPDAVLAWIDYCEWFIGRKGLPEEDKNKEVANFMQSELMTELNLIYPNKSEDRRRRQLLHKWDGTPTVKFPPEKNNSLVRLGDIAESIKADSVWRKDVMDKNTLSDAALNYLLEEFTDYFKDREYQDIADVKDKFDYWLQGEGGKIALINFENKQENVTQLIIEDYGKGNINISTRKEPIKQASRVKCLFDV